MELRPEILSRESIRAEFDRLSAVSEGWGFNHLYHRMALAALPPRVGSLLDAGCGTGEFARRAAGRCARVTAIDLSPGMIERARRTPSPENVRYEVADLFGPEIERQSFDAIVSIAALHHMDLASATARLASLLRPGGTLVVVDLFMPSSFADHLCFGLGTALFPPVRFLLSGRPFPSPAVRAAWAAHEPYDRPFTLRQVRKALAVAMPGASVRRHLFHRFSVIWRKIGAPVAPRFPLL